MTNPTKTWELVNKPKVDCPHCPDGKGTRRFNRVRDLATGEFYPAQMFGRCDREETCGFERFPKPEAIFKGKKQRKEEAKQEKISLSAYDKKLQELYEMAYASASKQKFDTNPFFVWLSQIATVEEAVEAFRLYRVGTNPKPRVTSNGNKDARWVGACIFWQHDFRGEIRDGKIMQYDENGKRIKGEFPMIDWVCNWFRKKNLIPKKYTTNKCFFGEHLLRLFPDKIVAVVESEKSAIVASIFFREFDYIWIAAGGLSQMQADKFDCLDGRQILLFPDLGIYQPATATSKERKTPFTLWREKAQFLQDSGLDVEVSTLLEDYDEEFPECKLRENSGDIADVALCVFQHEYREALAPAYLSPYIWQEIDTETGEINLLDNSALVPIRDDLVKIPHKAEIKAVNESRQKPLSIQAKSEIVENGEDMAATEEEKLLLLGFSNT